MNQEAFDAVDAYLEERLLPRDDALEATLASTAAEGIPEIQVAPVQGKWLHLLAKAIGARRILEVGTLAGYSAIWMARALPKDGRLVSLEVDPRHAEVAKQNLARAGVADRVDVLVGPAAQTLRTLQGPFDLVFIDADKESGAIYFDHAVKLARSGTIIVVDNVVREGEVVDPKSRDPMVVGTRKLFDAVHADPRVDATALQIVGRKEWDGVLMAVVR